MGGHRRQLSPTSAPTSLGLSPISPLATPVRCWDALEQLSRPVDALIVLSLEMLTSDWMCEVLSQSMQVVVFLAPTSPFASRTRAALRSCVPPPSSSTPHGHTGEAECERVQQQLGESLRGSAGRTRLQGFTAVAQLTVAVQRLSLMGGDGETRLWSGMQGEGGRGGEDVLRCRGAVEVLG